MNNNTYANFEEFCDDLITTARKGYDMNFYSAALRMRSVEHMYAITRQSTVIQQACDDFGAEAIFYFFRGVSK